MNNIYKLGLSNYVLIKKVQEKRHLKILNSQNKKWEYMDLFDNDF